MCLFNCGQCVYLSTFLWSMLAHHVVSEELLQELHLGNTEVEIQTAGHIHLQRVATHHHFLRRKEVEQGEIMREGGRREMETGSIHQDRFVASFWAPLHLKACVHITNPSLCRSVLGVFLFSPGSHPQPAV